MTLSTPPPSNKVKLVRIAHVYYTHKSLEKQHQFLQDFGLSEIKRANAGTSDEKIWYRGYGTEPFVYCLTKGDEDGFGGAAFVVESREELELAARIVPNASGIYELGDAPGGGECVTIRDPVDNFQLHLVWGQTQRELTEELHQRDYNFVSYAEAAIGPGKLSTDNARIQPTAKHRPANKTQVIHKGPAQVHKFGHFALCVTDFAAHMSFWTTYFNFKPSNIIHRPDGRDVVAFLHLDRGLDFVDHHSLFIFEGPKAHIHHSSFEVFDFDAQVLGHDWLVKKGYENCWGVGRHVLGSQIFDYWFDPAKFILEHYVDGDLVNSETPVTREVASPGRMHVWGPDLPPGFIS